MTAPGMELFATRQRANEGTRLNLYAPDGSPTDHWLQVRHVWSDEFQAANDAELSALRDAILAIGDAPDKAARIGVLQREAKARILAALVVAWSFDAPCTPEAVAAFLRDAPQIGIVLDKFSADGSRFFGNDSTSSTAGSSQNASSPPDSQTAEA